MIPKDRLAMTPQRPADRMNESADPDKSLSRNCQTNVTQPDSPEAPERSGIGPKISHVQSGPGSVDGASSKARFWYFLVSIILFPTYPKAVAWLHPAEPRQRIVELS